MAEKVVKAIFTNLKDIVEAKDVLLTWSSLDGDDTGEWVKLSRMSDKTVHVYGTWDSATLVMQGSNEEGVPTVPITMTDPQGNAISKTANFMEALLENPYQMRPSVSGGGGTCDITVIICAKGEMR